MNTHFSWAEFRFEISEVERLPQANSHAPVDFLSLVSLGITPVDRRNPAGFAFTITSQIPARTLSSLSGSSPVGVLGLAGVTFTPHKPEIYFSVRHTISSFEVA